MKWEQRSFNILWLLQCWRDKIWQEKRISKNSVDCRYIYKIKYKTRILNGINIFFKIWICLVYYDIVYFSCCCCCCGVIYIFIFAQKQTVTSYVYTSIYPTGKYATVLSTTQQLFWKLNVKMPCLLYNKKQIYVKFIHMLLAHSKWTVCCTGTIYHHYTLIVQFLQLEFNHKSPWSRLTSTGVMWGNRKSLNPWPHDSWFNSNIVLKSTCSVKRLYLLFITKNAFFSFL